MQLGHIQNDPVYLTQYKQRTYRINYQACKTDLAYYIKLV